MVWELQVNPDGTGWFFGHDGPLTDEEAAHLALSYAEQLWDITEGEHFPNLKQDLVRIRQRIDPTR
jgi:hypothetical protein